VVGRGFRQSCPAWQMHGAGRIVYVRLIRRSVERLRFCEGVKTKMSFICVLVVILLLPACQTRSSETETSASGDGRASDEFPTLSNLCKNEKIEIRHESWGCFHHYEDVFEISGDAPLEVDVCRLHPRGLTSELDLVEEKGTVALTETDIDKVNGFIAHYLNVSSQGGSPTPDTIRTTEDTIRLIWYRDGGIVEEVGVQDHEGSFPFLSGILSRAEVK